MGPLDYQLLLTELRAIRKHLESQLDGLRRTLGEPTSTAITTTPSPPTLDAASSATPEQREAAVIFADQIRIESDLASTDNWGGFFVEASVSDATTTDSVTLPVDVTTPEYSSTAKLQEIEPKESFPGEYSLQIQEIEREEELEGVEADEKVLPSTGNEELKAVVDTVHLLIERPHVSVLVRDSLAQGAISTTRPPRRAPPCRPRFRRPRHAPSLRHPWRSPARLPQLRRPQRARLRPHRLRRHRRAPSRLPQLPQPRRAPPRPSWLCRPRSPRLRGARRARPRRHGRRARRAPPRRPTLPMCFFFFGESDPCASKDFAMDSESCMYTPANCSTQVLNGNSDYRTNLIAAEFEGAQDLVGPFSRVSEYECRETFYGKLLLAHNFIDIPVRALWEEEMLRWNGDMYSCDTHARSGRVGLILEPDPRRRGHYLVTHLYPCDFVLGDRLLCYTTDLRLLCYTTAHLHFVPLPALLLQSNGFDKIKLFDNKDSILGTLNGSSTQAKVGIPNDMLADLAAGGKAVGNWIAANVSGHVHDGIDIGYMAVTNEQFLEMLNGTYLSTTCPAMQNVQAGQMKGSLSPVINSDINYQNTLAATRRRSKFCMRFGYADAGCEIHRLDCLLWDLFQQFTERMEVCFIKYVIQEVTLQQPLSAHRDKHGGSLLRLEGKPRFKGWGMSGMLALCHTSLSPVEPSAT